MVNNRNEHIMSQTGTVLGPIGGGQEEQKASAIEEIDFRNYYVAVRKRLGLVMFLVALAVGASVVYTLRQPKLYRSTSSIMLGWSTPQVLTGVTEVVESRPMSYYASMAFYSTQKEIIESRAIAKEAGMAVNLLADEKRTGLAFIKDPAEREKAREKLDVADIVRGMYTVGTSDDSSVITVSVVDYDPEFAAKLANALAHAFLDKNLEKKIKGTKDAYGWLSIQHQDLKIKLEKAEDKLYKYLAENNVLNASLESQFSEVLQREKIFVEKHAEVESKIIRNRLLAQMLKKAKEDPSLLNSLDEVRSEKIIHSLKSKIAELEAKRTDFLTERYQKGHPKIRELDDRIAIFSNKLEEEIEGIVVSLERKQESLLSSERGLRAALGAEREKEASLNILSRTVERLKREVEGTRGLYEMVTLRMKETDLSSAMRFNSVSILDEARPAMRPFKPSMRRNVFLGFIFGVFAAIGFALILDKIDDTMRGQEDVEQTLKLPFLGLMPSVDATSIKKAKTPAERLRETRKIDLFVLENPKSSASESARFIRSNLLFMSPDQPLRTLMVTSPSPQEGKTTTAINLAVAMGQSGAKTILVDCDMRRPRVHRTFGLPTEKGLSSVIVGDATLDQAISFECTEMFDVLVCGPIPPNPAELLHTKSFKEVIQDLSARYDCVIFDAPPVGAVADPVVLGTQMDGTLLVLKSRQTRKELALSALCALQNAKIKIFGAILNDVDVKSRGYGTYYNRYYHRNVGYYADAEDETPKIKTAV